MKNWVAITASGGEYRCEGSGVSVAGDGYYHNPEVRFVPSRDRLRMFDGGRIDWEWIRSRPARPAPRVGDHIVLITYGDAGWRISTTVKKVEYLD